MHKPTGSKTSIGNVIFQATMQLTVPSVTLTSSAPEKLRSHTVIDDTSLRKKIRCNLSSLTVAFAKHSHLNKPKTRRDTGTQTVTHISEPHSHSRENHDEREMTAAVTSPSKDYLSPSQYYPYARSSSCSSPQHQHPRSNTLVSIWPGLHRHNLQSSTSSLFEPTYVDERVKKVQKKRHIQLRF